MNRGHFIIIPKNHSSDNGYAIDLKIKKDRSIVMLVF